VIDTAGKTVETGKYIEVWRRINGKWLMVRDIWNDDAPPAPATAESSPGERAQLSLLVGSPGVINSDCALENLAGNRAGSESG